ncbi:MAG: phosphocholine cytidylyltransferase family protein [Candidatus Riflebacteria bacterium]|nr:phosphocholine cytidylyltransferase family protein [Candidatus Riflebacteria bacterium]
MKAIILAAGIGSRLKDVSNDLPKPLFSINGKSLLHYMLEAISLSGIREVTIVTGYRHDLIFNTFGNFFNNLNITYVVNGIYDKSGSMHSLALALETPSDCMVFDGDLVFNPHIVRELFNYSEKNTGIVLPCSGNGDEVFTVLDENNIITYLGKQHPGIPVKYEYAGITKLSGQFTELLINQYKQSGNLKEQYETGTIRTGLSIPWHGLAIESGMWSEIDSKSDIERATQVITTYWKTSEKLT